MGSWDQFGGPFWINVGPILFIWGPGTHLGGALACVGLIGPIFEAARLLRFRELVFFSGLIEPGLLMLFLGFMPKDTNSPPKRG